MKYAHMQPCGSHEDLQRSRKRVLIIEDHLVLRDLLVMIFTLAGYDAVPIEPSSYLAWMTDHRPALPDGVVLDADLFRYEESQETLSKFLLALRVLWQQESLPSHCPPLLILTTQPMKQAELEKEGYYVMTKPFKPTNLVQQMKKIIDIDRL